MNHDEYKALTRNPQGRAIRAFFATAASRQPDTSVTRIREALANLPEDLHDDLIAAYKELAEKGRGGASLFRLRQEADAAALEAVRKAQAADDLFGESDLDRAATDEDRQAARDLAASIDAEGRETTLAVADLQEKANAAERLRTGQV